MLSDRDIWATASVMIKKFGDDAIIESSMRADELLADGDHAGALVWKRIIAGIKFLTDPAASGSRH
jgi:hypothetical protein